MVKILQKVKIKILCKLPAVCSIYRVLFCTCKDLYDIMQIDCLAYKYFVFYCFSLVDYNIWYCVVCDYRGTPQISRICIYPKSECLQMIIIRIICEFLLILAVHTLPYLSHKLFEIMFLLECLLKFSCTNYINNVRILIMVCYSSCQLFSSIHII